MTTTKITLSLPKTPVEQLRVLVPPRQRSAFQALATNLRGGKDVTQQVAASLSK